MLTALQKYAISALSILLALSLATGGYYYLRSGNLENKVTALTEDVRKEKDANLSSQATITALKLERTRANKTCETRLQGYDATLAELVRIDGLNVNVNEISSKLTGGQNAQGSENAHGGIGGTGGSGDALLDALNGVFPMQAGGKTGICDAAGSGDAKGADVLPGQISYCFCSERDLKNWLKNRVLDQNAWNKCVSILDGMR